MKTPRRRRVLRAVAVALGALALLLVVGRLALTPYVERRLRWSLAHMEGMRGTFDHMDLSVLHLSWALHDLRVEKLSPQGQRQPYFTAREVSIGLYWRELLHRHLVGAVKLAKPKLTLVSSADKGEEQQVGEAPQLGKKLQGITPFRLDRVEVRDGELLFVNARAPGKPEVWLHGIEATLENFATRAALAKGEPSVLAASATLQRTGKVSLFASADPLAKGLTFAGQGRIEGLQLVELGDLLSATLEMTPNRGTLDMSLRFKAEDGVISGGIRPILKDPGVQQAKPGLIAKLKAKLVDVALDLLSDRVPGRRAVATTIPIHGKVTDPNAQLWPTVLGVVRNAFVTGLADSLSNLPPKEAAEGADEEKKKGDAPASQARKPPPRGDKG